MANCKNCGNELNGAKFCASCGTPANEGLQSITPAQNVQPIVPGQPVPGTVNGLPKDNLGLAGFICGILGITLCCGLTSIPGLICSLMSMSKVKNGLVDPDTKWMGIVGLVLSIIGTVYVVLWILYICLIFIGIASY